MGNMSDCSAIKSSRMYSLKDSKDNKRPISGRTDAVLTPIAASMVNSIGWPSACLCTIPEGGRNCGWLVQHVKDNNVTAISQETVPPRFWVHRNERGHKS